VELFPFRVLSQHGIQSMMIAHLEVPSIDDTENLPTTLSKKAITGLLKKEMGFDGLIITDGLGMKGVTKHYKPGEVEAKALVAGNDVLLLPEDVPAAFREIKRYLKEGKLDSLQIDSSVKKVLRAKYRLGLKKVEAIKEENIREELFTERAKVLKRDLIKNALTLVRNKEKLIPFNNLDSLNIASLSIGYAKRTTFQKTLGLYAKTTHYNVGKEISSSKSKSLIAKLKKHEVVIVGLHDMSSYAKNGFGLTTSEKVFIEKLRKETKVVLVVFGNPYSLKYFDNFDWVLEAYDDDEITEELAAQALYGAFSIQGRLPVTASPKSKFNDGITTSKNFRLGYTLPEEVGLDSRILKKIDTLALDAIEKRATPGCVVLIAKDGQVVFHKSYGFHTYQKLHKVETSDIYDLASITKIASSTISMMKLYDEGKVSVHSKMSDYLPELDSTNKSDIVVLDVMAHRAQLFPWIPFYQETITKSRRNPRPLSKYYTNTVTSQNTIPVTEKMYMRDDYLDEIKHQVYQSDLLSTRRYKYSDLGFYLINDLVKNLTNQSLDEYVAQTFYQPLGLTTAAYNPWKTQNLNLIVPTEEDRYFRRQKVQGYVHDMGAAMLGGVSGHAGLFANANDLAIIMQMILNGGYYGGRRYFSEETTRLFTHRHPECSRRGIGFDLKETDSVKSQNVCEVASNSTFGHLGFTGTCTWVDPEHNLVYIFLSNRTYPSMNNYKLNEHDYRSRIHDIIYEAMGVKHNNELEANNEK
jgi:CubicO group peptidase (beta-lactamase class C family)